MERDVHAALEKFRGGDHEAAFFELVELPGDVLPVLIEVFRVEQEADVCAFLVKVAWERRDRSVLSFLGDALNHARHPSRWKFFGKRASAAAQTTPTPDDCFCGLKKPANRSGSSSPVCDQRP
jgi:hypothetical protein